MSSVFHDFKISNIFWLLILDNHEFLVRPYNYELLAFFTAISRGTSKITSTDHVPALDSDWFWTMSSLWYATLFSLLSSFRPVLPSFLPSLSALPRTGNLHLLHIFWRSIELNRASHSLRFRSFQKLQRLTRPSHHFHESMHSLHLPNLEFSFMERLQLLNEYTTHLLQSHSCWSIIMTNQALLGLGSHCHSSTNVCRRSLATVSESKSIIHPRSRNSPIPWQGGNGHFFGLVHAFQPQQNI